MGSGGPAGTIRQILKGAVLCVALLLGSGGHALAAGACKADQVALRGDWGQALFHVEVADDEQERARGLMHRDSMPKFSGMLFLYPSPRRVGFWMKNTLIPLDMLFIDRTGTVENVHRMARPMDETPIFGGDDILAVLEINGGLAEELGIVPGTQIRHPALDQAVAAWPC